MEHEEDEIDHVDGTLRLDERIDVTIFVYTPLLLLETKTQPNMQIYNIASQSREVSQMQ